MAWARSRWAGLLGSLWLAGSCAWWLLAAWRIDRFQRLLRDAEPAPAEVQDEARRLAERLGLPRCPGVWFVPGRVPPLVWAVGGPARLILPAELWTALEDEQRTTILVHELAHLRRRDHWVRRLELVVSGLYWWLPTAWWARRALREAEEQCCDAWVVWAMPKASTTYANALLEALDFLAGAYPPAPAVASGIGHLSCLKRRLRMIVRAQTPRGLSWAGRLAVLGLACALLPLAPTWAQKPEQEIEQPAPVSAETKADQPQAERNFEIEVERSAEQARKAEIRTAIEELKESLREQRGRIEKEIRESIDRALEEVQKNLKAEGLSEASLRKLMEQKRAELQKSLNQTLEQVRRALAPKAERRAETELGKAVERRFRELHSLESLLNRGALTHEQWLEANAVVGELASAEADLIRATDRIDWTKRMVEKGYASKAQLMADELNLGRAKIAKKQAETKYGLIVSKAKERGERTARKGIVIRGERSRGGEVEKGSPLVIVNPFVDIVPLAKQKQVVQAREEVQRLDAQLRVARRRLEALEGRTSTLRGPTGPGGPLSPSMTMPLGPQPGFSPEQEHRLQELEQKFDRVLNELEELKRGPRTPPESAAPKPF
jgi:beta-lactamase regulating signal transducer with metallopeptidase domain